MLTLSILGLVGTLGFLVVFAMFARSLMMFGRIWELAESDDSPWGMSDGEMLDNFNDLCEQDKVDHAFQDFSISTVLQDSLVPSALQDSLVPISITPHQ